MKRLFLFALELLLIPVWIAWREHERKALSEQPTNCPFEDVPIAHE
jgi:hypothetical protein